MDIILTFIGVLILGFLGMEHLSKRSTNYNVIYLVIFVVLLISLIAGGLGALIFMAVLVSVIVFLYSIFK
jgi:hypothetical protein